MRIFLFLILLSVSFLSHSQGDKDPEFYGSAKWKRYFPSDKTKAICDRDFPLKKESDFKDGHEYVDYIIETFTCYRLAREPDIAERHILYLAEKNNLLSILYASLFYITKRGKFIGRVGVDEYEISDYEKILYWNKKALNLIIKKESDLKYYIKHGMDFERKHGYLEYAFKDLIVSLAWKYHLIIEKEYLYNGEETLHELNQYSKTCMEFERLPFWSDEVYYKLLDLCERFFNFSTEMIERNVEQGRFQVASECFLDNYGTLIEGKNEGCYDRYNHYMRTIRSIQDEVFD